MQKSFSYNAIIKSSNPVIMGVLNVTPDSFFDGGKYNFLVDAIDYVNSMINAGASIIDIGGESTRPGASEVNVEEELSRTIPVVEAIAQRFEVCISIDTSKSEVMRESAQAGAHIINDVRALTEPGALEIAAKTGLFICLTHMQGQPKNMQYAPRYNNIINDVNNFFIERIKCCQYAGIKKEKLLLDPGFGFGKNLMHNYTLLAYLSKFHHFGLPLVVGLSRKSMIRQLLNLDLHESLNGSLSGAIIAAMQGARIIRVHDVKETVEAIRVVKATLSARKNKFYE